MVGSPPDERSARRRDLYVTTQSAYIKTDVHEPGGSRAHNLSKRKAADLILNRAATKTGIPR